MIMRIRVRVGITALALVGAMVTAAPVAGAMAARDQLGAAGARALTSPGPSVSATALSSWQTNGIVTKLAYASGWSMRPGASLGRWRPPPRRPPCRGIRLT